MTPARTLGLLLAALSAWAYARADAIAVGHDKQLFIDDKFVTGSTGLERRMNPPVKMGAVLTGTNPWEDFLLSSYGCILEDQGKYRMWYGARDPVASGVDRSRGRICYAESVDGVHWVKPNLGLFTYQGSRANNILMLATPESCGVFIDPRAQPAERYKIVGRLLVREARSPDGEAPDGSGLYMYTSPDGLRWTLHPGKVFPFDPDTLNMALYDRRTSRFLAYVRTWNPLRRVGVVEIDDMMQPWPYDHGIPPRQAHGLPGPVNAPTRQIPDAFGTDAEDPTNLDFYTSAVVEYPWAADAYFMFPSAYRHFPEPPEGPYHNGGVLDVDLAVSRDGRKFHRVSRLPYVGLSPEGTEDSRGSYMFIGMIRRDGAIYQYYGSHSVNHGDTRSLAGTRRRGGVFLARQRLDGFVSLDAGAAEGRFSTPALTFQGSRLILNMDASATGDIRVEIQDAGGRPIAGHSFAESDLLMLNDVAKVVTWRKGDSDVGALAGKPVRLAFRLRAAKLYAFQFGG